MFAAPAKKFPKPPKGKREAQTAMKRNPKVKKPTNQQGRRSEPADLEETIARAVPLPAQAQAGAPVY
jgi:hypothetical protein